MAEQRVVLVKPGDLLVFGNVGAVDPDMPKWFERLKESLGLAGVVVFEQDIDMAAVPRG
jgi:hypothetical protein